MSEAPLPKAPASRPDAEPIASIPCPVLRAAAAAVAADLPADLEHSFGGAGEVVELLADLARHVAARRSGLRALPPGKLCTVVGRRLLELLRAQVVRGWADPRNGPPEADVMLEFVHTFEQVRGAIEPDWDTYFTQRLSGPDGLEMVVEVVHDLRSPLTSILFLAETIQRGHSGPVNDLQHRQLGLIYSAALGLSTMVSNVLELARGGSRLTDDSPTPFSITDVFESVHDIVRPMAEEKGLQVRLLPPASDHRLGHAQALSRVLLNLTTNAIKFTEEGVVELVARATSLTRVEFSVRDTGRGIHEAALKTLYLPFRRIPAHERYAFSGTGLGLALSRKLVEVMGSRLEVETRPNWGTRFFFELDLPLAQTL
jgi:signal transduction histidine kinase